MELIGSFFLALIASLILIYIVWPIVKFFFRFFGKLAVFIMDGPSAYDYNNEQVAESDDKPVPPSQLVKRSGAMNNLYLPSSPYLSDLYGSRQVFIVNENPLNTLAENDTSLAYKSLSEVTDAEVSMRAIEAVENVTIEKIRAGWSYCETTADIQRSLFTKKIRRVKIR